MKSLFHKCIFRACIKINQKLLPACAARPPAVNRYENPLILLHAFNLVLSIVALSVSCSTSIGRAAETVNPAFVPLLEKSFFYGHHQYLLQSGQTRMFVQTQKVNIAPAFTYLLFDAEGGQNAKRDAFNFVKGQGMIDSALEVVLGKFAYTAQGENSETRWTTTEGIPAVEAVWWAGGIRVTERIFALKGCDAFIRRITLESKDLLAPEKTTLRLNLPPGDSKVQDGMLIQKQGSMTMALGVVGKDALRTTVRGNTMSIGPIELAVGQSVTVDTLLLAQLPAAGKPRWQPVVNTAEKTSSPALFRVEMTEDASSELDWAHPAIACDPVFKNIMVSYKGCLHYRVFAPRGKSLTLAFGVCEGFHKSAGQRILEFRVDGKIRKSLDPIAEFGPNVPGSIALDVRVEDDNGFLDVTVQTAPDSVDKNPILSALWVFDGTAPASDKLLQGSANKNAAAFYHAMTQDASLAHLDIGKAISDTRESWDAASKITSRDPVLSDIYVSASNTLPAVIAESGIVIAGPFQYGDGQWVRDSSNTLIGAIHAGHFELARAGLERILKHLIDEHGSTRVAGEIQSPDLEQFDQMGEFLQTLKAYRDFTGDDSLVRQYREKIIAMVERPLKPEFRDATTGMVHNRREYWERTFDNAYELIYQAYVVLGLRTAADLAEPLEAGDRAAVWRAAADKMWKSATSDPKFALVEGGKFIKRRNVDGKKFDIYTNPHPYQRGSQEEAIEAETTHALNPDSTAALPAALRLIDPRSPLSLATLDDMEKIRCERWRGDGYMRYASTCELNQIGPWPFATCFVLRAQHDAGLFDRSRRSLEWLHEVGPSGAWTEAICAKRSGSNWCGVIVWTTGEIPLFAVRHVLGIRFDGSTPVLKPLPYPGTGPLMADLRFRKGRLKLDIPGPGPYTFAEVDGKRIVADKDGAIRLPADFTGGTVVFHVAESPATPRAN
jgi:hypothetical protein